MLGLVLSGAAGGRRTAGIRLGGAAAGRPPVVAPLGVLIGFVPSRCAPWNYGVVLLLFLPALLFWESLNASLREESAAISPT